MRRAAWFLALALTLGGCGPRGMPMTPAEVDQNGTHSFHAPKAKVFDATIGALKTEGYEIAWQDKSVGSIKTGRKVIRTVAVGSYGTAQATDITRQYIVKIKETDGAVAVSAEPRIFAGERDLSSESVWQLEGPEGERTLWARLFKDIDDSL